MAEILIIIPPDVTPEQREAVVQLIDKVKEE
jgi:hypothetical protein